MKTVAYCRVSTNKEEQLDSLESQRSFFLEYAKKHNYNLIHIYADEGKSGTRIKNRIQLQQLLNDAKDNRFDLLLIKDVSRLARNTVDFLISIRKLKTYGIKVVFVNYDQTSSDSSEFMLTMLSAIAQEESANTSKRIKFGKKVNAEKGRVPNICYGYNKLIGDYFDLDINVEEAEVVKTIFSMYTKELMGTGSIAKQLNQREIKTKRGCKWTQTGVMRVLSNEIYTGKIINSKEEVADFLTGRRVKNEKDKWIIVKKPELQIVSELTYKEASDIMNNRRKKYNKTKNRTSDKHVFSKLVWCQDCGYHYRRMVRTYKNTYVRWVCNGRNSNGADSCHNKTVLDEGQLLDSIRSYYINILFSKSKYGKYIVSQFCKRYKEKNHEFLCEKNNKKKLYKLDNLRNKYIKLYQEDIISLCELRKAINEIQEDTKLINKELEMTVQNISKIKIIEKVALEMFQNLDCIIMNHEFTNSEIKRFVKEINVNKNGEVNIYITGQNSL